MSKKNSELIHAATRGDALGLQLALDEGADPKAEDSYALMIAAGSGHAEIVKLLIPISDTLANDSHALLWAASNGHADCLELLIPVSDPTADDSVSLRRAAGNGHDHCVELLIPVSDPTANNSGALRAAAANTRIGSVALLLPFSDLSRLEEVASAAKKRGHMEVAGMIESFMEAKALSESCPKKELSQNELAPLKGRGLSL